MKKKLGTCALCGRNEVELTRHHLIPKEEGGTHGPCADICMPCHKHIHALYSNRELAVRLSSIKALREDEKIKKYLKWIWKQPSSVMVKTKRARTNPKR